MKYFFIDAKYKEKIKLGKKVIDKLPKKIGLITTIQFVNSVNEIKKEIEESGRKVKTSKGIQKNESQVLGCESSAAKIKDVDAILYVGTGKFHPINVAIETKKEVYSYNPIDKTLKKLDKKEIEKIEKKKQGAYLKYIASENIGIIVTTKPGQNDIKKAFKLKQKLEKEGKHAYIFVDNTYNLQSLEDFNFIEAWVNTACPRIIEDFTCVNINQILK